MPDSPRGDRCERGTGETGGRDWQAPNYLRVARANGAPSTGLRVSRVRLATATADQIENGLLGWVSFVLNGTIRIDGVALRRILGGRLALSFPARTDRYGNQHHYVRPLGKRARREIEQKVLEALELREVAR